MSRVLDVDLQGVVNGLWASGAEAIAVNGQRLTGLTTIRAAGGRSWSTSGRHEPVRDRGDRSGRYGAALQRLTTGEGDP